MVISISALLGKIGRAHPERKYGELRWKQAQPLLATPIGDLQLLVLWVQLHNTLNMCYEHSAELPGVFQSPAKSEGLTPLPTHMYLSISNTLSIII